MNGPLTAGPSPHAPGFAAIRSALRVDHAVTAGTFSLDGKTFEVENNIWVLGDERECVVIDAPHSVADILTVVGGRTVTAIVCTHAHDDHVRAAPALRSLTGAPILLHPADQPLWELTHPTTRWDVDLKDGDTIDIAGSRLHVSHTPGHAPGAVCLYSADLQVVFTGDTLFHGGPVPPDAPTATSPPSRRRSARSCSPCPRTPQSTPDTARTRRSPPRPRVCVARPTAVAASAFLAKRPSLDRCLRRETEHLDEGPDMTASRTIIMGPPGAGKGTQAALLADSSQVAVISTGDIFRSNVTRRTALGLQVEAFMRAGQYVPDSVTNEMVRARLREADAADGFLLDGYPRTLQQVDELDAMLAEAGHALDVVLHLVVDSEMVVERLLERARIEGRADDTPSVIRHRLEVFAEETAPLVEVYSARGLLLSVDGHGSVTHVQQRIQDALDRVAAT